MKKKDGFPGQQSYVIPDSILERIKIHPLCNELYITDIGYYPMAGYHFRERIQGIPETILIYNIEGNGLVKITDQEIHVPPDHFIIIPQNTAHAYAADENNPWSIYWIHYGGAKAKWLAQPGLLPIPVPRTNVSRINERIALFDEIFHHLERGYSIESLEYVNLCLPRLLASFIHLLQYRSFKEPLSRNTVDQTINFMLENINHKLKLDDLAKAVKLSTSHFSRLFFERTGHSPINYFIQLKIQRSCHLLDNTTLSVSEIAREIGMDDPFYFSRQFGKVMNMSPTVYRKR